MDDHMTSEQLNALDHDLNVCDNDSDYEVVSELFCEQFSGTYTYPMLGLAKIVVADLRATRAERDELREYYEDKIKRIQRVYVPGFEEWESGDE